MNALPSWSEENHPLSSVQHEVWLEQSLCPTAPVCNIGGYNQLSGRLDVPLFLRAIQLLVQETEALRLRLTLRDGIPRQAFPPVEAVAVPIIDCSQASDPLASALSAMRVDMQTPFPLYEAPLFRQTLYKVSEDNHLWAQVHHHLAIDGRSYSFIVERVIAYYHALTAGEPLPVFPNRPYRDFIASDAAYLASSRFAHDRHYWLQQFAELPEPLFLPHDNNVLPPETLVAGGTQSVQMPNAEFNRLEALAKSHSATLFQALIALFSLYFCRLGEHSECVIGIPVLNRNTADFKNSLGLFAGMIPVRIQVRPDQNFIELMQSIAKTLRETYRHQRFPMSEITRQAKVFEAGRNRLFDFTLSFDQHAHPDPINGLAQATCALNHGCEQSPLALYIGQYATNPDVQIQIAYNFGYFSAEEIAPLAKRWSYLLSQLLAHPEKRIADQEMMSPTEKHRLLQEWQAEPLPPRDDDLCRDIEAQAVKTPEAIALCSDTATISYGELNQRANQLAHYLTGHGACAETKIGIALERTPEMILALLAVLKSGSAFVPIDPDYPEERIRFMLEDSGVCLLITQEKWRSRWTASPLNRICLDDESLPLTLKQQSTANLDQRPASRDLAYVLYTSGSTGKPKGVQIEHGALAAHCRTIRARYRLTAADHVFQFASFSFDTALEQILPTLSVGACLVLPPHGLLEPERLAASLLRHRVSVLDLPPALFRLWASTHTPPPALRLIILGGEALPPEALAACAQWPQPWPQLLNVYGPTEACISTTVYEIPAHFSGKNVPIGRPLAGRRLYVLNRDGQPVPTGVAGELHLGGIGIARGYLNQPQLTARQFIPDPFSPNAGERLYKTGDLARFRHDGQLEFLGRIDQQIKIRGFRIEPGEIESLLKECDGVEEAVLTVQQETLSAHVILRHHTVRQDGYDYHLRTAAQSPALPARMEQMHACSWPAFFAGDAIQTRYWPHIYRLFPELQFAWLHEEDIALAGNMVPLFWEGDPASLPSGWDAALEQAIRDRENGRTANTVCVLAGVVSSALQGRNLSYLLIGSMARIANRLGFRHLIVPVRPTLKPRFADMALSEYAGLTRDSDGLPLDPWLRVHRRLGARILAFSAQSQTIKGDLDQWREWTNQEFTHSGDYRVEGALQPVHIDVEKKQGLYHDQSIWVEHDLSRFRDDLPSLTTPQALRSALARRLPAYMLPARLQLIDHLPLTPSGKIDRQALAATLEPRSPLASTPASNILEEILSGLWANLLNCPEPGPDGHFFELGGHSLLATQLASQLRDTLAVTVPVRWIFETPRLGALAARLRTHLAGPEGVVAAPTLPDVPANRIQPETRHITPDLLPLLSLTQPEIDRIVATVDGGAANVADIYPLAPLQEGILFHHQWQTTGDAYISHVLLAFDSRSRVDAFLTAFQAVIVRHETLRSAIVWEGLPQAVQVVWRHAELPVEVRHFDPAAGPVADQLLASCHPSRTRMDLSHAPLRRVILAEDGQRWLLVLLAHHINEDHTSLTVLLREIEAHQKGRLAQEPLPVPYRNFVHAVRSLQDNRAHESFFRAMLGEVTTPTLPFGLTDIQGNGDTLAAACHALPLPLSQRLRQAVRRLGATPAALCHLAWAVFLSRCCAQDEVVFGTVLFGRMHGGEGIERAFGLFMNTLPIRLTGAGQTTGEALRQTQQRLLALMPHEQATLSLAQQCSAVPAPAPLFSSLFNYRHSRAGSLIALEGVELLRAEERSNYPIGFSVDDLGEGFQLTAQTDRSIDPDRLCTLYQRILEALVHALEEAPQTALHHLDVLPQEEKDQLLGTWNQTATPLPYAFAHEWFEQQVLARPQATAVVFEQTCLSYHALNRRANQLAHYLIELGIQPDECIAIALERSPDMIVAALATLKAGAAYVPLDPEYPADRLAFMLEDCAARLLITHDALQARLPASGIRHLCLATAPLTAQPEDNPGVPLAPHHLAYLIYTSGSTGRPKGVAIEHRGLVNLAQAQITAFGLTPESRVLQFASFSFDASVSEILMALCSGAALYLPNREERQPGFPLWQTLRSASITHVTLPPTALATLPTDPLPALQTLIVAGESCPPALAAHWAIGRRFFNAYGPTEITVCASLTECRDIDPLQPLPIGRPIANTRTYVLDAYGQPVPVGVAGELHLGGIGIARGYLNQPQRTAQQFIPDPFSPHAGDRLYKTGDLARFRSDGQLEFLGRIDQQIKIRGFRIEPGEIENTLTQHPLLQEAVVIARQEKTGDLRLIAYLVPTTADQPPALPALQDFLRQFLPDYMLPAVFVFLPELPLTPNGKVNRQALPEPGLLSSQNYQAPRDPLEQQLTALWESLLQVHPIGLNDNFFHCGGHSLLTVRLANELQRQFGQTLSLSQLFAHPTIKEMALLLRAQGAASTPCCRIAIRPKGSRPPLFFLPGAEGIANYLYPLAQHLDPDIPFITFQAQGLDGVSTPHANIDEMATHYLDLLLTSQPKGPYYLGGHSAGAHIAFVMANKLRSQGVTVEQLILVDAPAPSLIHRDPSSRLSEGQALLEIVQIFAHRHPNFFCADKLAELTPEIQFETIARRLEDLDLLPRETASTYLRTLLRTLKAHLELPSAAPSAQDIPILLLRASDPLPHQPPPPDWPEDLGWGGYSNQPISIQFTPGDHLSMMTPPHVAALAAAINTALRPENPPSPAKSSLSIQ